MKPVFGEIVLAAGGIYSSKPRPVLVFQNQEVFTGESILVIPLTSVNNPEIQVRVAVKPSGQNGLDRDCYLEVDKLSAIKRVCISESIGVLEAEALLKVQEMLSVLLKQEQGRKGKTDKSKSGK